MADALPTLTSISEALDSLGLAMCVFDDADAPLLWNRTFLAFFPEHAEQIRLGSPQPVSLRRFYERRRGLIDSPSVSRYVPRALRHGEPQRPYAFDHQGVKLWVASLPLPGVGLIRIWKPIAREGAAAAPDGATAALEMLEGLDHVADGIMVTDADGRIVRANEPFARMYGLDDRAAALGLCFEDAYRAAWRDAAQDDEPLFASGLATLAESLRHAGAPFELPLPGGRWIRVVERAAPDGRHFVVHVDISDLKRQHHRLMLAEQQSRASEAVLAEKSKLLEATLERMEQGVMMVNAQRIVEVCNRRALDLLGLPRELMASKPSFEAVLAYQWATDEFRHTPQDVQEFVRSGGILDRPHSYDRRRPDGRVIEVNSVPIEGGGVLRTYTDVTARKQAEERIRHVARHDGLTALVNREAFLELLGQAVQDYARTRECFAVLYIDLDGFKPVNDRHGHRAGDQVLAQAAARMRRIARDEDIVARIGGDEFAVLQYRVGRTAHAVALAERILEGIRAVVDVDAQQVQVGASIGIAVCCRPDLDSDALMRHADVAMYEAKAGGRNCVKVSAACC
jgi:diguanylate cyclase (GGDEF)-like protein/PAS domain S-box-containing protein